MGAARAGATADDRHRRSRATTRVLSLVMLVAVSTTALWRAPDASARTAATVTPPTVAQPTVTLGPGSATVSWTASPGSAGPIQSYVVTAYDLDVTSDVTTQTVPAADAGPPTGASSRFSGLRNSTRYAFTVTAVDANGAGDPSPRSAEVVASSVAPFFSSDNCVRRQYDDLLGIASLSAVSVTGWKTLIDTYGNTCAWVALQFWLSSDFQDVVPPLTRLYQAYFLRIPDYGGLDYWVARVRAGQLLDTVSASFAASPEFRARYGALDDAGFLTLVYRNVLGRAPDQSGYNYWLGLLDQGRIGRGSVMLLFSNSLEFQITQNPRSKAEMLYVELLRRSPTPGEVARSSGNMPNTAGTQAVNTPQEEVDLLDEIVRIMSTAEYRQRANGPITVE